MRVAQLGVAGILILVLAAVVWIGVSQLGGSNPATVAEVVSSVEQNKQSLLDGIAAGQPLYYKVEKYQRDPIGPAGPGTYPNTTISENWFVPGEDGRITNVAGTLRNLQGELLGYSQLVNGVLTYTDIGTGMTMDMAAHDYSVTLESVVEWFWALPQALQSRGYAVKEPGTLNQRESLIYERATDGRLIRVEVVEDAPILFKESHYEGDTAVQDALTSESTFVEYKLLPVGRALPDPATEG